MRIFDDTQTAEFDPSEFPPFINTEAILHQPIVLLDADVRTLTREGEAPRQQAILTLVLASACDANGHYRTEDVRTYTSTARAIVRQVERLIAEFTQDATVFPLGGLMVAENLAGQQSYERYGRWPLMLASTQPRTTPAPATPAPAPRGYRPSPPAR